MLFTDLNFFILVVVTMLLYYLCKTERLQVWILILASLLFYSYHTVSLTFLLLFSALSTVIASYLLINDENVTKRRIIALAGVGVNLSILCYFKYAGLLKGSLQELSSGTISADFLVIAILPVGISFYTFQGISMVIDTFRKDYDTSNAINEGSFNYLRNGLFFIIFFPQLVAGPVVKAKDFLPQIKVKRLFDIKWWTCIKILILGYFLKVVIANNLHNQTVFMEYPRFEGASTPECLILLLSYSIQIFADFSGYSLIAIGIAGLFGYQLPENFNFPYLASSFSDFWRRWHISLSSWLRDYLYFPLGGNRKGKLRTYINLMIVMGLGGLWHGAAWSYFFWGIYHGLLLSGERFLSEISSKGARKYLIPLRIFLVFTLVSLGWTFFKLPEFSHAISFLETLFFSGKYSLSIFKLMVFSLFLLPMVLYHINYLFKLSAKHPLLSSVSRGVMLWLILTEAGSSEAFIYFQF